MRKLFTSAVIVLGFALPVVTTSPVAASPADEYSGPYVGAGNLPPGCGNDVSVAQQMASGVVAETNVCHRMRTGMNGLDSPQVDVLILVPVSPTVEQDMRITRQAIEMWEGGIDYLATEMGLDWLAGGMDFHITVDSFDPTGQDGGEFTTYPVVDPEIVVVVANPVGFGSAGIGIDPVASVFTNPNIVPCQPVGNPFDIEQWENVPGFNSHHESRSGTYVEDCGEQGGGGNVCFAVNAATDPAPDLVELNGIFDLVAHEVGHCLTVGHVGDGLEGSWGALPPNDIMAYSSDPPGLNKCVSTLDVEGVALTMSKYLDVNGDGAIDARDLLRANDQVGEGGNPFQVQHPDDHLYASSSGSPLDCPQPDLGPLPGAQPTDWTPAPVRTNASAPATEPQLNDGGSTGGGAAPAPTATSPQTSSDPAPNGTSPQPSPSEPAPSGTAPRTTPSEPADGPDDGSQTRETTADAGTTPDAPAVTRIAGADRIETSVSTSRLAFGDGQAGAVVLTRADQFADGLAGTSLAVANRAPILLSPGSGLDARVAQEIRRVLPTGRQVFVLGGPAALTGAMDAQLEAMGYRAVRLAGADRFETSVRIAAAHPRPQTILLATGRNYADALAAGAAAAEAGGLVLLTNDSSLPPSVSDYLARNGDIPRVAIGGPAALASPGSERLAGSDRFETSVIVARRFFASPNLVGLASGVSFADALSGGALLGHAGAPLVLTDPNRLSSVVADYLSSQSSSIDDLFVIGGESAVAPAVVDEARETL